MRTVFVCELRKLCRNSSFMLFGALLLLASVLYPFGRALAPDANGVNLPTSRPGRMRWMSRWRC